MQFSLKISRLMRERGLSTRSLGASVGVSNGTVAGWTRGAKPQPDAAKRLSDYFGVPVETLLDDSLSLPEPTRKETVIAEMPPDSKWHDLSKEEKQRLVSAVLLDSKQVQDLLQMLPQLKRTVAVLEAMAKPAGKIDPSSIGEKNLEEIVTRGRAGKGERKQA